MTSPNIDRILYGTQDASHTLNGKPVPAMTTLLHKVCGRDSTKFDEAIRLVTLFIEQAMADSQSWIKVTEQLLNQHPDWLDEFMWVSHRGFLDQGRYEWRQGRNPERLICASGENIYALDDCYVMPMRRPEPVKKGSKK